MTFCSLQSRAEGEISLAKIPLGPQPIFARLQAHRALSVGTASTAACRGRGPGLAAPHTPLSRTRRLSPPTLQEPKLTPPYSPHPTWATLQWHCWAPSPLATHRVSDSACYSCLFKPPPPVLLHRYHPPALHSFFFPFSPGGEGGSEEDLGFGIRWMNPNSDLSPKVGFTHQLWASWAANLTALSLSFTR